MLKREEIDMKFLWHPKLTRTENAYVLFKGRLYLDKDEKIDIHIVAKDNYRLYINREERLFGPARFAPLFPEYASVTEKMKAGETEITCIVHKYGIDTRFSDKNVPCFFACEIIGENRSYEIEFDVAEMRCFQNHSIRNNPLLGWMEIIDYSKTDNPAETVEISEFVKAVEIDYEYTELKEQKIMNILDVKTPGKFICSGTFIDRFGSVNDNPAMKFMLRDLETNFQPDGIWIRYDLCHVGLYRPEIVIKAPKGTIMETGYSCFLFQNRVNPVIPLTGDASHNLDRFILSGEKQKIQTFNYRGFRFLEVHVYGKPEDIEIYEASANQRTYYPEIEGIFSCNDERLNRIWEMCAYTVRNCSEDALTDTPVRERGQWTGDMMASGIENISVFFGEMSLPSRSIIQAYDMRSPEGLVPAQYPGHLVVMPMYSLMWICGSLRYFELTGDKNTLEYVYNGGIQTIESFMRRTVEKGVLKIKGSVDFIDWGYHHIITGEPDTDTDINVTLNIYLIGTINKMIEYDEMFADSKTRQKHIKQAQSLQKIMHRHFYNGQGLLKKYVYTDREDERAGFNSNVTALYFGLVPEQKKRTVIEYIKEFILSSYPANPDATLLADPNTSYDDTITPYFGHFTFAALIENGEIDFVLEQYRTFWGWMLDQGLTTAAEVFDIRWSHCHAWSACPGWQLSRYILGIWPAKDLIIFRPVFSKLEEAHGFFPDVKVTVEYKMDDDGYNYRIKAEENIKLVIEIESKSIIVNGSDYIGGIREGKIFDITVS